jgi:hypothetical protein
MATNLELERQVKDLTARVDALAARFDAVIVATSPPCAHCGKPVVEKQRTRVYLGRIKMAMDVWLCPACAESEQTNAA